MTQPDNGVQSKKMKIYSWILGKKGFQRPVSYINLLAPVQIQNIVSKWEIV